MAEEKKKRKRLQLSFNQVQRNDVIATEKEMRDRLMSVFRFHIGREYSISQYELFSEIFRKDPLSIDIYKRCFYWSVLKRVLNGMRKDLSLFVAYKRDKFFVVADKEDAKFYKGIMDNNIKNMCEAKKRCDEWVRKKLWEKAFD
jgi:hypothetical protein